MKANKLIDCVVGGIDAKHLVEAKQADVHDTMMLVDDYLSGDQQHIVTTKLSSSAKSQFKALVSNNTKPNLIPLTDAREYLKAFKAVLKGIGQYGGVPAKLKKEKEHMQEIIDEIVYAIKHPE